MMGFAGQLSLGHALYVGGSARYSGGARSMYRLGDRSRGSGCGCDALCVALGVVIGFLAVPFRRRAASTSRCSPSHSPNSRASASTTSTGPSGSAGMFLPVAQHTPGTLANLRGASRSCSTTPCCLRSSCCAACLCQRAALNQTASVTTG